MTVSNLMMKKLLKGNKGQVDNIHVNGIALAIFVVFMLSSVDRCDMMDKKVNDWLIAIFVDWG